VLRRNTAVTFTTAASFLNQGIFQYLFPVLCMLADEFAVHNTWNCRKEKQVKHVEVELEQEKRMTDSLVADMVTGSHGIS